MSNGGLNPPPAPPAPAAGLEGFASPAPNGLVLALAAAFTGLALGIAPV